MTPLALNGAKTSKNMGGGSNFDRLIDRSWQTKEPNSRKVRTPGPNGEDWPFIFMLTASADLRSIR